MTELRSILFTFLFSLFFLADDISLTESGELLKIKSSYLKMSVLLNVYV